ncbi:hypothetical protein [Actinoplanes teichomyceticus]|uniref:Neocarzinostatin family protein n=1 Tax=Actinoplanes teichomyceticus TaxID=1867 RepID=A0A561VQH3_ACTTI|nr:hypothetical protein [Actinoplanes teichomyceticus]TWG13864.1 hypothetical protein FHX34_104152 [Actinoplanes teichomyceticus]GIF12312.1 hypothetical protein Ate01nite_23440 [Actinoplanes teichomyceticus]
MRTMLQLLGGVAVAGAVAAGSTAFTAAGLTTSISSATIIGGGKVGLTVDGAVLSAASLVADGTYGERITGATLTLAGASAALPTTATVTGVLTGTSAGGTPSTTKPLTCSYNSGTTKWDCTVANTGTDYLTVVTALDVTVAA